MLPLRAGDRVTACPRDLSPEEMAAIARYDDPMSVAERMKASAQKQKLPDRGNLTVAPLGVSFPPRPLFQIFEAAGTTPLSSLSGAIGVSALR